MKSTFVFVLLMSLTLVISGGCANIYTQRTYSDIMNPTDEPHAKSVSYLTLVGDKEDKVMTNSERMRRAPLSEYEKIEFELENELKEELTRLEGGLASEHDYFSNQKMFDSISQRIYFLNLTVEDQAYFLNQNNPKQESSSY